MLDKINIVAGAVIYFFYNFFTNFW